MNSLLSSVASVDSNATACKMSTHFPEGVTLGFTDYLAGQPSPVRSSLPKSIADLEDTSILFVQHWQRSDHGRAGRVSEQAMIHLDFVANEFLREKVERLGHGSYQGSLFAAEMNAACGSGVTGTTFAEQVNMVAAGPGNGRIPANVGTPVVLTLDRLLNKIKHRNRRLINFRIEAGKHIFLICPEHTSGGAEGIYEFDVEDFCNRCSTAAATL